MFSPLGAVGSTVTCVLDWDSTATSCETGESSSGIPFKKPMPGVSNSCWYALNVLITVTGKKPQCSFAASTVWTHLLICRWLPWNAPWAAAVESCLMVPMVRLYSTHLSVLSKALNSMSWGPSMYNAVKTGMFFSVGNFILMQGQISQNCFRKKMRASMHQHAATSDEHAGSQKKPASLQKKLCGIEFDSQIYFLIVSLLSSFWRQSSLSLSPNWSQIMSEARPTGTNPPENPKWVPIDKNPEQYPNRDYYKKHFQFPRKTDPSQFPNTPLGFTRLYMYLDGSRSLCYWLKHTMGFWLEEVITQCVGLAADNQVLIGEFKS